MHGATMPTGIAASGLRFRIVRERECPVLAQTHRTLLASVGRSLVEGPVLVPRAEQETIVSECTRAFRLNLPSKPGLETPETPTEWQRLCVDLQAHAHGFQSFTIGFSSVPRLEGGRRCGIQPACSLPFHCTTVPELEGRSCRLGASCQGSASCQGAVHCTCCYPAAMHCSPSSEKPRVLQEALLDQELQPCSRSRCNLRPPDHSPAASLMPGAARLLHSAPVSAALSVSGAGSGHNVQNYRLHSPEKFLSFFLALAMQPVQLCCCYCAGHAKQPHCLGPLCIGQGRA